MRNLGDEIVFKENGVIQKRANHVLEKSKDLLKTIEGEGLFNALEKGVFADVKRPKNGGKGLNGVFEKDKNYFNPFIEEMLGADKR